MSKTYEWPIFLARTNGDDTLMVIAPTLRGAVLVCPQDIVAIHRQTGPATEQIKRVIVADDAEAK